MKLYFKDTNGIGRGKADRDHLTRWDSLYHTFNRMRNMPRIWMMTPARSYAIVVAIGLFVISPLAVAQDDPAQPAMAASTATDATIPVDHLKVLLRPQTRAFHDCL